MTSTSAFEPSYAHIFNQRANDYHEAMRTIPAARRNEFITLFSELPLQARESVIDIPSGGGYLENYLELDCNISCFDFSSGFAHEGGPHIQRIDSNAKLWPIGQADRVVSLAGLHHFDDPIQVVERLYQHVIPGGMLHIADVAADSAPGHFLNGFVDRYNPQGHQGVFFPTRREAWPSAWQITRLRQESIPWNFPDVAAMTWFCCMLFGVSHEHAKAMQHELATTIGYTETAEGCALNWSLLYMDARRLSA